MSENQRKRPIFLVGSPRSGTTLLRDLLCSHERLALPLESQILPLAYGVWGKVRGNHDARLLARQLLRYPTIRGWGVSPDELEYPPNPTFAGVVACIFQAYANLHGKARWGDKTPLYVKSLPLLRELFPECQIIHIIRDGRDVSLSVIKTTYGSANLVRAMIQWRKAVEAGILVGRSLGRDSYREVRYEELLQEPETTLRDLLGWLGEDYSPAVLCRTTLTGPMLGPPTVVGENSHKWRTQMSPDWLALCQGVAGEALVRLGYPLIGPSRKPTLFRALPWLVQHKIRERIRNFRWDGRPWLAELQALAKSPARNLP